MMSGLSKNPIPSVGPVVIAICVPLPIIATVLRFIASRYNFGKVGVEGWLALSGLIFFLAVCLLLILYASPPFLKHFLSKLL